METSQEKARRREVSSLFVDTFNSVLRIEEMALKNRLTSNLTISEIHTINAIGLDGASPMNVVAGRLGVTLATLNASVGKLVDKGFAARTKSEADRRQVLVSLTKEGRKAYRVHEAFHREMVDAALDGLTPEEEDAFARGLVKVKAFFESRAAQ